MSSRTWTSPCLYYKLKGNKTHKNKGVSKMDGHATVTFTQSAVGVGMFSKVMTVMDEGGGKVLSKMEMVRSCDTRGDTGWFSDDI